MVGLCQERYLPMDRTGIGKAGHHPTQQQEEKHQMDEHL